MEDIQEAFTRRMLRRASLRRDRDRDGVFDSSNEDLQRRCSILKAIDNSSTCRESSTDMEDREKLDRSYDHREKSFNSIENSCNNNNVSSIASYNKIDGGIEKSPVSSSNVSSSNYYKKPLELAIDESSRNFKQIDDYSRNDSSLTNEAIAEEKPGRIRKVRVREKSIEASPKMMAQLKNIDNKNSKFNTIFDSNLTQVTQSSVGSLSAAIDELDEQIKNLEMRSSSTFTTEAIVETREKMYPVLEDIKFEHTGYTIKKKNIYTRYKNSQSTEFFSSEDNAEDNDLNEAETRRSETYVKDNSDEVVMYHQTPKSERKMPIMESTRKCSYSDSTKIKFPSPSRVESTISSIAVPATPDYNYKSNAKELRETGPSLNNSIPYEVERFLEDALGDELYNTTVTYAASEARDRTNSHFNASELISEDRTPLRKRIMQVLRPPMTEPPPKNSSTLNRSMGIYRSLSQRIKKKFRAALKTREDISAPPPIPSGAWETDRIRELLQEISVQQTLMNQATKALNVCHTMKEFMESSERIESERLLLLASLRRKAALEEMKKITSDESSINANKQFLGERGEITIKDINLNLRECLQRESQDGETIEWFLVVVSQGLKVWATRAIGTPINNSRISLPEAISIANLTPSFKILVEVYSLKLRIATYNHEDKYRIDNKHKRSSSCPPFFVSPTKILKKVERPLSPKIAYNQASKNRNTSFVLSGFVELFLHDLSLSSPWPLMVIPANSILQGTIDLSLSCRLHLSVSHEGFLNHGDEAGGFAIWNRRWCVLKGHTLMFWNYPREQETKDPLTVIELINCVSNKITTADRTICAKPRTLLIETVRRKSATDRNSMIVECRSSCTIVRNLLSCDSVHELMEWSTKLNHVIFALREWNVIGTRTKPQVSDL